MHGRECLSPNPDKINSQLEESENRKKQKTGQDKNETLALLLKPARPSPSNEESLS